MKKYIFLIFLFLLFSCSKEEKIVIKKYYETWIVQTWSVILNTSYVWYVESEVMLNLSSKVWGKITGIYKKEWDKVKAWELVAELDWLEAKSWYSSVDEIISSLELMKNQTSSTFDSQIDVMKIKIEQAKTWNAWIEIWLLDVKNITENQLKTANSQIEQAKVWLEITKTNLEQTKQVLKTKKTHIYKNTLSAITNSVILDTNILYFIDSLIWSTNENKHKNDRIENYFWKKNTSVLNELKEKFITVNKLYLEYKALYEEKLEDNSPDNDTIKHITEKWLVLADKLKVLLNLTYKSLDNSVENPYFSQETINAYKQKVSEMGQNIESSLLTISWEYILWLKWSIENMDSFETESYMQISLLEKQVSLAKKALKTAKDAYNQYLSMSKWQINEVSTQKEVSNLSLKEAEAWLQALIKQKQTTLSEIQAKINEAKAKRNEAFVMISNSKVTSSISWVVVKKISEVWQIISWGMPILVVADPNKLQIKIWVDEEQRKSLKIWDIVKIETDIENKQLSWIIKNIYPTKDQITKKNIVEISLNDNLKIWLMLKVCFVNNSSKEDSIIIPNWSITQKYMIPWVYVLENKRAIFKNIRIIKQWDSFSEIKGLKVWEIVITKWKENIYDTEILVQ